MNDIDKNKITSSLLFQIFVATILDLEEARQELPDPYRSQYPSPSECAWRHIVQQLSAPLDELQETRETAKSQQLVYLMANSLNEYVELRLSLRKEVS